ncbi:uncharacterized protein LOC119732361 [Patiria miniata]|uniref:Uncharacterized protein n=1 Tax=Patiria miniata TaxID=46514 RepID=A0A914AE30_PATMI|nr:uncharacterized protein LOC119732361 [Patiria miniata]
MAERGECGPPGDEPHQDEPQECAICYTEYIDPRLLECSHKFCLKCLRELSETPTKEDEIIVCPMCRARTVIPQGGVQALPQSSEYQIKCQACDEANPAVSKCLDCDYYLCCECQAAHQRLAQLRTHRIAKLDRGGKLKSKNKCEHHPDQDLCFYCNTCEDLICKECTSTRHKKSVHSFDDLSLAMTKCKQEVGALVSQTEKNIQEFLSANPSPDDSRKRLETMLTKTRIQISLKAEKEIAKIRQKEEQLRQEAEELVAKRDKEFAFATTARKVLSNVSKVMTSTSSHEVLWAKKKLLRELKAHKELKKAVHKQSFLGLHASEVDGEIGTLVQQEKWECKSRVNVGQVNHFAVFSAGDVATSNTSELKIMNLKGEVLAKKTTIPSTAGDPNEVQNPTALAVNNSDDVVVLDSPLVKTFDKELKLLHHFTPGKEADIDGTPTCLAVSDSYIAIGYKDKEQISLHNSDGSLIRKVAAPMIAEHLTTNSQQLIYTNESKRRMIAIDLNGKQSFNLWGKDWIPRGLCCDVGGDIYVIVGDYVQHYGQTNPTLISSWSLEFSTYQGSVATDITFSLPGLMLAASDKGFIRYNSAECCYFSDMAERGECGPAADEPQEKPQECAICYTEYIDPRLLECSHKFCLKCLKELSETPTKEDDIIVCPMCRARTVIPQGGVQALPQSSEYQIKCQACDEANTAVSKCLDCDYYLCCECKEAHQRFAQLRTHRIASLDRGGKLKSQNKCEHHPDQNLCFYCNTCELLICNECTTTRHNRSVHSYDDLGLAMKKCKQEVDALVSQTEKNIKEFLSANPSPDDSRKRLNMRLTKTRIRISLKAEKEIAKIRQKEEQLRHEAEELVAKTDKEFTFASTARPVLSNVSKVMTSPSSPEVLGAKKKLLRELKAHRDLKTAVHKQSFLGLHASEVDGEIGTLVQQEKWECKSRVNVGQVNHFAVFSAGDVATSNTSELKIMNLKGEVLAKKTTIPSTAGDPNEVQNPTALAVNNSDDLVVLDSPLVNTFNKKLKLLHHFTPGSEADIDGTPTCLAVSDSYIAVGYQDKEQISLHNSDGSLIRKVAAPMIAEHLTTNSQQLIYIDENKCNM